MKIAYPQSSLLITLLLAFLVSGQNGNGSSQINREWEELFRPLDFGSNKPHLMFQVGSRNLISHSLAYGYWL
jgi:hypothetical protein